MIKNFKDPQTGKLFSRPQNIESYFYSGLTWSRRTTSGISFRILPGGCIFADKGPAVFASIREIEALLALMNSKALEGLIALQLGAADVAARSYDVGLIQKVPIPDFSGKQGVNLSKLAMSCVQLKLTLNSMNETSHVFYLPSLLQLKSNTLTEGVMAQQAQVTQIQQQLIEYQHGIDEIAFQLYDITDEDRQAIEGSLNAGKHIGEIDEIGADAEDEDNSVEISADLSRLVADLLSYMVGCAFGRWDVRYTRGERAIPDLPDPFAPLPACSPAMLIGHDDLLYVRLHLSIRLL